MADNLQFQISVLGIKGVVSDAQSLDAALKLLYATLGKVTEGSQAWSRTLREIREATVVQQRIGQFNQTLQGTQTASANASMALLNLNYVIRDSPYFFQNFALGLLAVGNNLNPLIDSFNRLRKEAVEQNISTFAY